MGDIQSVGDYHSIDGGSTYKALEYPASIDSKRVGIRYKEDGGIDRDGVIEIRRGVADLNLGPSHYAQVRILVDGSHYLKGMAMYSDDIPDGVDIMFNTNKPKGTDKMKVLKPIGDDPDNPFGAAIKADGQSHYIGKDGKEHLSAINKLKYEGDWEDMSKNLSSQFLSKQPMQLIKKQLDLTYANHDAEFKDILELDNPTVKKKLLLDFADECLSKQPMQLIKKQLDLTYANHDAEFKDILELDNPTVKKKLLLDFADECDSAAVHLKAAALPRQSTQVILPMPHLKDTEVYAPNYKDGEQIALVRYPHGGTFEIPVLTVNNRSRKSRNILPPDITDAIGINPKVAERLSGADFDGDQVVAIPTNRRVHIQSTHALKDLEGFDPKTAYPYHEGMRVMKKSEKGKEMGMVSNLITDMTLRGADESELARAVKHSMVVIDAEKHKLDYKQSEKDQGIKELKQKYQTRVMSDGTVKYGGASTLLSRRDQDIRVPERQGSGRIDPDTGQVIFKESGRTYTDRNGKVISAATKSKLLAETPDLHILSSGTPQERAYADYGNKMKALANEARKAYLSTGKLEYHAEAKTKYEKEVSSLNAKLNVAEKNAPRERRAQAIANSQVKAKIQDNPGMDKKDLMPSSMLLKRMPPESVVLRL